ncbi:hypothetical protein, partial [Actinobaculum suis]|uniref:hypothetical protein n=1 Tax=Actinobaculum suis TaxID=1657 RepID=UPI001E631FC0
SQLAESVGSASTSGDSSVSGADRSVNSGSDRDRPEMASESVNSELTRGGLGQPAGGSGEEVSDSGLA